MLPSCTPAVMLWCVRSSSHCLFCSQETCTGSATEPVDFAFIRSPSTCARKEGVREVAAACHCSWDVHLCAASDLRRVPISQLFPLESFGCNQQILKSHPFPIFWFSSVLLFARGCVVFKNWVWSPHG